MHTALGDRWRAASVLEALGAVATSRLELEYGAQHLGAAEALRDTIGTPLPECERPLHEETESELRRHLSPDKLATAWAQGRARSASSQSIPAVSRN